MRRHAGSLLFTLGIAFWLAGIGRPLEAMALDSAAGRVASFHFQAMRSASESLPDGAALSSPWILEDLSGEPAAYLYPVVNGEAGGLDEYGGYVTVGARLDWAPLIERTESDRLFDAIALALARGDGEGRILFFGPFRYVVELIDEYGAPVYYRLPDLAPMTAAAVQWWDDEARLDRVTRLPATESLWDQVADGAYFRSSRARKVLNATAVKWYRGCGPTSVTMMLLCYGQNGYPGLWEETSRFFWCGAPVTTARFIHDQVADHCGLPTTSCDYNQYGVTSNQMRTSFTGVAAARGYNFSAQVDGSPTYGEYQFEIDNDDPVGLAIYQDNGPSNYDAHAIMGLGYDFGAQHLAVVYDTWDRNAHDYALENFASWQLVKAEPNQPPAETPTPTPRPTSTPTSGPTATPTPSPRPPTFTPTSTPTAGPGTPTPTATSAPGERFELSISTNDSRYTAGSPFSLELEIDNHGDQRAVDLFVILDLTAAGVPNGYFFYPAWSPSVDCQRIMLHAGTVYQDVLLQFTWPAGAGQGFGLTFWAVLCLPNSLEMISNIDSTSFSYY